MTKLGVLCKSPQALEKYYWIPTRWIYQNSQNIHVYDNVYIYNVLNHLHIHIYIYMLYVASYRKTNRPKKKLEAVIHISLSLSKLGLGPTEKHPRRLANCFFHVFPRVWSSSVTNRLRTAGDFDHNLLCQNQRHLLRLNDPSKMCLEA